MQCLHPVQVLRTSIHALQGAPRVPAYRLRAVSGTGSGGPGAAGSLPTRGPSLTGGASLSGYGALAQDPPPPLLTRCSSRNSATDANAGAGATAAGQGTNGPTSRVRASSYSGNTAHASIRPSTFLLTRGSVAGPGQDAEAGEKEGSVLSTSDLLVAWSPHSGALEEAGLRHGHGEGEGEGGRLPQLTRDGGAGEHGVLLS